MADADHRHAVADAASVDRRLHVRRQRRRRLVEDGDRWASVEEPREAKSLRLARRHVSVPAEVRNGVEVAANAVDEVAEIWKSEVSVTEGVRFSSRDSVNLVLGLVRLGYPNLS